MRILFLADGPRVPVITGDRLRNWRLVEILARRHEIEWWAMQEPGAPDPGPVPEGVRGVDFRVPAGWEDRGARLRRWARLPFSSEPLLMLPLASAGARRAVERVGQGFDVLHCSHLLPWRSVPASLAARCVVDLHDSMSLRYHTFLEADPGVRFRDRSFFWHAFLGQERKLRRYERGMPERAGAALVVARRDRDYLGADAMQVVPNGVDSEHYRRPAAEPRAAGRILFFGNLAYRPNADAAEILAREVLPPVRARVPGAHVRLVGADPGARVRALAELPGVTVVGRVEDMRGELARAELFACPIRVASGLQNKVLEALAMELPTAATPMAAQGLELEAGRHLAVAPLNQAFIETVVRLLERPDERAAMAREGRAHVERAYSWEHAAAQLESIYQSVARRARAA